MKRVRLFRAVLFLNLGPQMLLNHQPPEFTVTSPVLINRIKGIIQNYNVYAA